MENHLQGVPSNVAIAGHPIHPMLIVFPVAFLVAAFVTDLASRRTADPFWARASLWLTGAGLTFGALAAVVGAVDFVTIPRARVHIDGWVHMIGNVLVLTMALGSLLLRRRAKPGVVPAPALALSAVIAALLVVTGWYGGELSYRHMIGVIGHGGEREAGAEGQRSGGQRAAPATGGETESRPHQH
jgi:uncharacterized membrane protein